MESPRYQSRVTNDQPVRPVDVSNLHELDLRCLAGVDRPNVLALATSPTEVSYWVRLADLARTELARRGLAFALLLGLASGLGACDCQDLAAAIFEQKNIDCVAGDQDACAYLETHTYGDAVASCPVL